MAMSSSELLRRRQEETKNYVSRSKVRDSSELTLIRQAKASTTEIPVAVNTVVSDGACQRTQTIRGNGTNMEYGAVLAKAQSCAICADTDVSSPPGIYIPTPCYDRRKAPFAQQDLSGNVGSGGTLYVPACKPGNLNYFPRIAVRGDDCNLPHLPYDS